MALIENSPNADSYLAQFIFSRLPYPLRHAIFAAHATRKTRLFTVPNANGSAPTSNSQPPHAMRKVFSAKLESDYSSANLVLKNLGI